MSLDKAIKYGKEKRKPYMVTNLLTPLAEITVLTNIQRRGVCITVKNVSKAQRQNCKILRTNNAQ